MTALLADALVDWGALGKGALFAFVGGVGVVVAFSFVVLAGSRISAARREDGRTAVADVAMLAAGALVCVAALVVGLLAMMHKS